MSSFLQVSSGCRALPESLPDEYYIMVRNVGLDSGDGSWWAWVGTLEGKPTPEHLATRVTEIKKEWTIPQHRLEIKVCKVTTSVTHLTLEDLGVTVPGA